MTCQDQGVVERERRRVSGFERSNDHLATGEVFLFSSFGIYKKYTGFLPENNVII